MGGLLIAEGRNYLATSWWLTTLPGAVVVAVVLAARPDQPLDRKGHPMSLLDVRDLAVSYDGRRAVEGISFTVDPGEVVALVGESGSGKSTTAHAVIGLLPGNATVDRGRILLGDADLATWSARRMEALRGAQIGLVPQDPANSLNPVKTIGAQVGEVMRIHGRGDRREIRRQVVELLTRVGLPDPETRARQYPHELSGGMRQRVLIAIAIALRPRLVIADEPTSALDATVQRRILDLVDDLRAEFGTAVLLVTHDLGVAASRSDRLVVMRAEPRRGAGPHGRRPRRPPRPRTRRSSCGTRPPCPYASTARRSQPPASPRSCSTTWSRSSGSAGGRSAPWTGSPSRCRAAPPTRWWGSPAPARPPRRAWWCASPSPPPAP
ncbi:ABC transporter ATP-binding protein [Nonomuraea ferruginea]